MVRIRALLQLFRALRLKLHISTHSAWTTFLWGLISKVVNWVRGNACSPPSPPPPPCDNQHADPKTESSAVLAASMDPQSSTVKAQSSNAQESPPPRSQGDIEMGIIENSEMRATATDEGTPQRRTTTDTATGQLYSERIIPMVPEFFQRYDRIPPAV